MTTKVIDIIDGRVVEALPQDAGSKFINTLIDSVELAQAAERICPDDYIRQHIHIALLALTCAVAEAAQRVEVQP